MEHVAHSRSPEHDVPTLAEPTIAAMLSLIAADETLPKKRRADICSGVRTLCRALHLQIESTPADPRLISGRLAALTPAAAGMSKGRFQNCKSHMDAALAYADRRFRRKRSSDELAPAYVALLQQVSDRWDRAKLRRLFHFASEQGIAPHEIGDVVFDEFLASLHRSTLTKIESLDRSTRRIWNRLVTSVPGWPGQVVKVPSYVDHYVLSLDAFPDSLRDDLEKYLASRKSKGASCLDELLTEEELFGDGDTVSRHQPIRDSTAELIHYRVRQFASALVLEGIASADTLVSLDKLVAPMTVAAGLKFFIRRAGGDYRNSQIRGLASDLLMIAKLWVRSSEAELKKLGRLVEKVRPRHEGLPESARRSLAPFRNLANVRAFLSLPEQIVKDAEREKAVDRASANRVAAALWIKIAQRAPLRIANLLSTDLAKNVVRSPGKHAAVALFYPADQVKNEKVLEIPLPQATVELLDLYLQKYRPALVDKPSLFLFPAPDGEPKRSSVMSSDIQRLMRNSIGFSINPHSFRHVAAKLYLSVHPGRHVDVQLLLGHRRLETTIKYYCELQAEEAFKHFDAILLGLEDEDTKGRRKR